MPHIIPIAPDSGASAASACDGSEAFALMVLGDSMRPEFAQGEVVVIEPAGRIEDGSFVLAQVADEWILRQLRRVESHWRLCALDPAVEDVMIGDLDSVRGVVIQRVRPGRRKETKFYIE